MNNKSVVIFRTLDIVIAGMGLLILFPLMLLLYFIGLFDTGVPLVCQERVGRRLQRFILYKFRTMTLETPEVPSHLANYTSITPLGMVLRQTKLDELPQLWNVLLGDMSLVGPRPSLINQYQLIKARHALGVYSARPGITGLAQVSGINMSTPELLAKTDASMLNNLTVKKYFQYIFMTIMGKGAGDNVTIK